MKGTTAGWTVLVSLVSSVGAAAQETGSFESSLTRSFLEPSELNRADCANIDGDATVTLRGSAPLGATFRGFLLDNVSGTGDRPQCLTLLNAETEGARVFDADLTTTPSSFLEEIELPLADLLGDACETEEGLRSNDTALCVYMMNTQRQELTRLGFFIATDTHVPPRPTLDNLRGGDGRLVFDIGNVEDTPDVFQFLVQHRPCSAVEDDGDAGVAAGSDAGIEDAEEVVAESICDAPGNFQQTVVRSQDVTLTGLKNNVMYEVRVVVRDEFGNESEPSEAATVTPQKGVGPLDFYTGSGSPYSMTPSCGAAKSGSLALFGFVALLGVIVFGRRRSSIRARARSGAWLSLLLMPALLASTASAAQGFADGSRDGEVTFSLFGGPYHPGIDNERRDGAAIFPIYGCFFDDATLVELGASLDYHLIDVFGSLQIGLGLNATQAKGNSLPPSAAGSFTCGEKTDDSVELTIIKVKPQLTYRLDPLLDWFGFPLVPYGRLALVGAGYAFTNGGLYPDTPSDAQNPVGLVLGWEAAGGLMLALDFWDYLDPFSRWGTKRARANDVFNHAYVYGEAMWQPVDNFGRPSLILSPTDPFTGTEAPWTVHFGVAVELL